MSAKKFSCLMIATFVLSFCVLVLSMFFAKKNWSLEDSVQPGMINFTSDSFYQMKIDYVTQKKDFYDSFIFGGSKAGALDPQKFSKRKNKSFYNLWVNSFSFEDYEKCLLYLISIYKKEDGRCGIKELVLHLSSHTVEHPIGQRENEPLKIKIMGKTKIGRIKEYYRAAKKILLNYTNINLLKKYYKERNEPANDKNYTKTDGSCGFEYWKTERDKDREKYLNEYVYNYWSDYAEALENFFSSNSDKTVIACEQNIASIKRIKDLCDTNGIKLTVIVGPTFLGELYKYASAKYIQYMKDFVKVCPVWNFSGINDVNLNPDNFCDGGHYFDFVGDKMTDIVCGQEKNTLDFDAFGTYLTEENIDSYIESQRIKFYKLKDEWIRGDFSF